MQKVQILRELLADRRSGKVVFLSHCLLNENTRYLGGACTGGCVAEVVAACQAGDYGIVQLPCPEREAWGGVTKRLLLMGYGSRGTLLYFCRFLILPLFLLHTKIVYRRLARRTVKEIRDYLRSGFTVAALVGIDGSPTCGVGRTVDLRRAFALTAAIDPGSLTVEGMNAIIRQSAIDGQGLFIAVLRRRLARTGLDVPILAHDLIGELDGAGSTFRLK